MSRASVKRVSDTTADFSYDSDAIGTLYYTVVKQGAPVLSAYESITEQPDTELYAKNISPLSNEPTEEYLLTKGKEANMSIGRNKVKLSGLEKNTPYTLYYMGVDTDTKMTPVKQIDISRKPAVVPKPPKPAAYTVTEVVPHFNPKGTMETGIYWFTVTFDKDVEEELTTANFKLTCPALSNLNVDRIEKVNNTTYNVYNNSAITGKNTLTMTVTFADGSKSQKQFYFNVLPPYIDGLEIERVDENTVNIAFNSDNEGEIYYKACNEDEYAFDTTEAKDPADIYASGTKATLKYGSNSLKGVSATEGQRFCYATKTKEGTEDNTFFYSKPIESYPFYQAPDPDEMKIIDVEVKYKDYYGCQFVYVTFDQEIDYFGGNDVSPDNPIQFPNSGFAQKLSLTVTHVDEDGNDIGGKSNRISIKINDPSLKLAFQPGQQYTVSLTLKSGKTIEKTFTVGASAVPSSANTIIMDDEIVDNGIMDDGIMDDDSMTNEDTMTPDEDSTIGGGSGGSGGNGGTVDSDIPSDDTNNTPDGDTNDTDVDNTDTPDGDTSDTDTDSTDTPDGDKNDTDVDSTETPDGDTGDTNVDSTETPDGDTSDTNTDNTNTPDSDTSDSNTDNTNTSNDDTNNSDTSSDTPSSDASNNNTPSISQSTKPNDGTGKDDSDGGDSGNGDNDSGVE